MPGTWVEVRCAECGAPMRAQTGTITIMRTKGKPLVCADCQRRRAVAISVARQRRLAAEKRARKGEGR